MGVISNIATARPAFPTGPTVFFPFFFFGGGGGGGGGRLPAKLLANTSCGISTGTG